MNHTVLVLLVVGCAVDDVVAEECVCSAGCAEACDDAAVDAPPRDFCQGTGPIVLGDDAASCLGRLAETSFRYALCSCRGIVTGDGLSSDSFDSRQGPYRAPGAAGGAIGSGGGILASGGWSVEGSLIASGGDTTSDGLFRVAGGLYHGGALAGAAVEVGGDAHLGGGIRAERLTVGGTLVVPPAATIDVDGEQMVGATERREVDVAPPCACDDADRLDIEAIVLRHVNDNDNRRVGIGADELAGVPMARTLELPCGLYFLNRIVANVPLTIRVTGRVALFVRGDISASEFAVELDSSAELDLFVAGNLTVDTSLRVGRVEGPAQTRVYIGGGGTIQMPPRALLAANIYAPGSELVAPGALETFGSLLVERLSADGEVRSHYDQRILEVGDTCQVPLRCDGCGDCPGTQACVDGSCGGCRNDADCCAPLRCNVGRCDPLLL